MVPERRSCWSCNPWRCPRPTRWPRSTRWPRCLWSCGPPSGPRRLRAGFDQSDITMLGSTVGTPMLTNVLGRRGIPFELVVGSTADTSVVDRLARVLHAGAVARLVSRSRIARVGRPINGYDCVDIDDKALRAATGVELVPIGPAEVRDRYLGVSDISVVEGEIEAGFEDVTGPTEGRTRSLRLAMAMEELDSAHRLDAGAMNCHVAGHQVRPRSGRDPLLRFGPGDHARRSVDLCRRCPHRGCDAGGQTGSVAPPCITR